MKNNKISIRTDSYAHKLLAAMLLIGAGIVMVAKPSMLKLAFLVISIIILEIALIKITIYFAVRPYEKRMKQFYGGISYWIAGFICLALYFIRPELIYIFIGILLAAEGGLGIVNTLKNKKLGTIRVGALGINAGVILAGATSIICAEVFKDKMLVSGVIIICGGVFLIAELILFIKAESIAKKSVVKAESEVASTETNESANNN